MKLNTENGLQTVTKFRTCTSKSGKTVYIYTTAVGTFISKSQLKDGSNVSHAVTDPFG